MAKILCKNCRKMCEDSWTVCPGCGKPLSRKSNPNNKPQQKPKTEKSQTIIKKEDVTESSPTLKPKKRIAKTVSAPSGGDMNSFAKSLNTAKPKNKRLDFTAPTPAVATATSVSNDVPIKESFLDDDTVEDVIEEPVVQKTPPQKTVPAAEQKQYPVARGLRRINKDNEEDASDTEVARDQNEQQKNNTPLGLPQMELFNIPGAPYPVTYMEQPAGANGAMIKIPYLVTDKGLQPWINTPPVVDGETRPIPEVTPNTAEDNAFEPDIEISDTSDEPDFDFDPESEASVPDFEDNSPEEDNVPAFDEPDFDEPNFEAVEAKRPSVDQPKETDSHLFEMPEEDAAPSNPEEEKPVTKPEPKKKKKTKEEQLDEEDEEAFAKALRVTSKSAEKEEKKKKLKDMLDGKKTEEKATENDGPAEEGSEESETSFDGFNPNADHYYDDTPPTYPSDRDHITVDFILRVFGAFALIIFVVVALIYMV